MEPSGQTRCNSSVDLGLASLAQDDPSTFWRNSEGVASDHRRGPSRGITIAVGFAVRATVHACLRNLLGEGDNLVGKDLHPILPNLHTSLYENRIIRVQKLYGLAVDIRPGNDFDKAALVFQIETTVAVAFLVFRNLRADTTPPIFTSPAAAFSFNSAIVPLVIFLITRSYLSSGWPVI